MEFFESFTGFLVPFRKLYIRPVRFSIIFAGNYFTPIKQTIAILFFTALLFQSLSRFMILADYSLNRSYIANVLCENKSKPSMHCNGKCYLSKKLQEDEKQQAPGSQKTIPEIQLFIGSGTTELTLSTGVLISSTYGRYNMQLTSTTLHNIFRPPVI